MRAFTLQHYHMLSLALCAPRKRTAAVVMNLVYIYCACLCEYYSAMDIDPKATVLVVAISVDRVIGQA